MTLHPKLEMSSPDQLLASLPFLLGFKPNESLVVVWTIGGRLLLTQRVDLPAADDSADLDGFACALARPLIDHHPDEAVLIVVDEWSDDRSDDEITRGIGVRGSTQREASCPMPMGDLVTAVTQVLTTMNVIVRDALHLSRGRYRSYLCQEACCPVTGRVVDPVVATAVAASFALRGVSALSSRDDLVSVLESDPIGVARLEPLIIDREQEIDHALGTGGNTTIEGWRDEQVDRINSLVFAGGELSDADSVTMLVGLCDVRVRDTFLWHLNSADDRYGCLDRLLLGLRLAPNGYVAPIATCAALVAWLLGDGARASIAIDRALNDDPTYSLAILVGASISAGLPPSAWQDVMGRLTVDACRARPPAA